MHIFAFRISKSYIVQKIDSTILPDSGNRKKEILHILKQNENIHISEKKNQIYMAIYFINNTLILMDMSEQYNYIKKIILRRIKLSHYVSTRFHCCIVTKNKDYNQSLQRRTGVGK